ncbi:hypothetical protein [Nocardioides euryhalodurans]|uniref:Uncharacterized protein n=1 Tax=Nocardioides euryhalodurans TaxID=2518370 RepID=A0A4P7GHJ9_9ACTN|nr:hypothetical protein [Nocardioides euryhalodurans]QBR91370.1 hypothetical protein EXE57_03110 [Nocardioides euryhalodurans]
MADVTVTAEGPRGVAEGLREDALPAARTLATITLVGLVCGWLVAGVLSRLAMLLLVELNPVADGVTSDDGFIMGRFTLSGSLNLMFVVGTFLGLLGAAFYVALRGLRIGPPWFRLLSISIGGGVVVGAGLVHTDGVDFRLLEPVWLAVALFVAVPATYVALLSLVSERLLARDRPLPTVLLVVGVGVWVVFIPMLPIMLALVAGWLMLRLLRGTAAGARALDSPVGPWVLRGWLAVVFALAVVDIARDVAVLT